MERDDLISIQKVVGELFRWKIDEVCRQLNDRYEQHCFYVRDGGIYIDCSDYSPRDVKVW